MSRLSRTQRAGRESAPSVSRPIGDHCPVGTKETLHKRVSLSGHPAREGSPLGEAAPSRPGPKRESEAGELLTEARVVFPARRKLYSTDVFGRRHEIETKELSEAAYQSLLEACQNPVRYDGPPPEGVGKATEDDALRELPEGCKIGPLTELPLPEWWELPGPGASGEEIQIAIRRNFERAARSGKGSLGHLAKGANWPWREKGT